jgi:hypothetical protein
VDLVSLIVAALAAGALAGVQGTATEAVKDAYAGLKALVRGKVSGKPAAEMALERHGAMPEQWAGALEAELVETGAGHDGAVVEAARTLMRLLDAAGSSAGKYDVDVRASQGVQVGDGNRQTNTFASRPPKAT